MQYTQLTKDDVKQMLSRMGVSKVEDLFADLPAGSKLEAPLDLPPAMDEMALRAELNRLQAANQNCEQTPCFLGGGIYDHFIPSVVDELSSRSEFVTAYTPYQAEAAQGALQALYEYQTLICQLTGMDVANASLYEGASAAAEAVLMARAVTGRRKIIVSESVHPETREVLETYVHELPLQLELIPARNFRTDTAAIKNTIDEQTAAVLLQTPNFAGCVEPMSEIADAVHEAGGLLIASIDPVSVGLMKTPGDQGADIVVGEGQALGVPMSYGGPALGLMACRQKFLRKLPGRVVGATRDRSGRRAFCLTLQTREQHIRRERATSNICTNQGLLAIRAVIYLSAVGPAGLKQVASLCLNKTQYAASQIGKLPGFEVVSPQPFFKEFVVRTKKNVNELLQAMASRGLFVGPALEKWDSEHQDCFLVAVTEKRTKSEIDQLVSAMKDVT